MKLFNDKKQKVFQIIILDECNSKLKTNIIKGRLLNNKRSSNGVFLVDHEQIVKMQNKSCDCREYFDYLNFDF